MLRASAAARDGQAAKTTPLSGDGDPQLKLELAEALAANGRLQARVKAAEQSRHELSARSKSDERLIESLQREKATLARKVKDRDEELRGKSQLLVVRGSSLIMAQKS